MGTSFFESMGQVFRRLGFTGASLQLAVWATFLVVQTMLVLMVVLSGAGNWSSLIYVVLFLYTPIALGIVFSPVLWTGVSATAVGIGQIGGEVGLSAKDGVDTVVKWSKPTFNQASIWLLFFVPVALWYLAEGGAAGWVKVHVLGVILLPAVLTFVRIEFPVGKFAFQVIGWGLMLLFIALILNGVFGIVSRQVTDPDVQVVQQYEDGRAAAAEANNTRVAERIKKKLEKAKARTTEEQQAALTTEEWEAWQLLSKKASGASGAGAAAGKARAVIEQAKPDDMTWWKDHWYIPAGILALLVLVAMLARKKTAVTTTAGSAPQTTEKSWWKRALVWEIASGIVIILLWIWWVGGPGYAESMSLKVTDRTTQEICGYPTFPSGKQMMFVLPGRERGEIPANVAGSDGNGHPTDLARALMVQGVTQGKPFLAPTTHCVDIHWAIESGHDVKLVRATTIKVMILRHYTNPIMKWIMSLYY